jgi:DNA-binding transcriptional ArsR family regulator
MRAGARSGAESTAALDEVSGMDIAKLQDNASKASVLLKTMANEWRLLILCHLAEKERSVSELERLIGLNQSALSQHLAVLRRENLVKTRREAQSIYYSLASEEAAKIMSTLYMLYCAVPGEGEGDDNGGNRQPCKGPAAE